MWSPDDLDIQIIKALASPHSFQWDVRISNAHVAKGLDVDEETVRNRLRHMKESGFLQGWELAINPIILDREAAIVELQVDDPKTKLRAISELKLMENVTIIENFYGKELAVHIMFGKEDTLIRQVKLISLISGSLTPPVWWRESFPPCGMIPTKTDWLIIKALRENARGRLSDVAKYLNISNRTVKRHMQKLVEGNVFYLNPLLDPGKSGGLQCRFLIVSEASKKQMIDTAVRSMIPRIISIHTASPEYSLLNVHCENALMMQEIHQWLKNFDGIKEVHSNIEMEFIYVHDWIVDEIQQKLST